MCAKMRVSSRDPNPDRLSILARDYLDEHPYFLSYRFGYDVGQGMVDGLDELQAVCRWAQEAGYRLTNVDSDFPSSSYDRNRFFVGFGGIF